MVYTALISWAAVIRKRHSKAKFKKLINVSKYINYKTQMLLKIIQCYRKHNCQTPQIKINLGIWSSAKYSSEMYSGW